MSSSNSQAGFCIESGESREIVVVSACKGFIDLCSVGCPLLVPSIVTHLHTHGCDSALAANK